MARGTGRTSANTVVSGVKVASTLLKLVGVGLAAGIALVAGTDKVMSKAFPEETKDEGICDTEEILVEASENDADESEEA